MPALFYTYEKYPPVGKTAKSSISPTSLRQIILLPTILQASVSTFLAVTYAQNVICNKVIFKKKTIVITL